MASISSRLASKTVSAIGLKSVLKEARASRVMSLRPTVLVFLSPSGGVNDFIRLGGPALLNETLKKTVSFCLDHLSYDRNIDEFNISGRILSSLPVTILVAREKLDQESFEALLLLKQKYPAVRLIVDIDDDLYALPKSHPEYDYYQTRLSVLASLIEASDVVTASTEPVIASLKDAGNEMGSCEVIPNYLDDRVWEIGRQISEPSTIKVLYAGTETHDEDLRLLEKALPKIKERVEGHDRTIEFVVVGGTRLDIDGMSIVPVPDDKRAYPDYVEWLQSLGDFSFAIAPLNIENRMNHAKSGLKYLEYSAMGLPAVFTDIEPYHDIVKNGETGILVQDNDLQLWEDAIVEMALNGEKRQAMSAACREDLKDHLLLTDHFDQWKKVISNG